MVHLTERLAQAYIDRPPCLKQLDMAREDDHTWFLSQEWVGMALYADGVAGNLKGLLDRLPCLSELGVNMVHMMPILKCPEGAGDGGYAVSNFPDIDPRAGTLDDLCELGAAMRRRGMLLTPAVRKGTPTFADFNNQELVEVENPHLFAFLRTPPLLQGNAVVVVANFDLAPQYLDLDNLGTRGHFRFGQVQDLASGHTPAQFNGRLVIPPCPFYWLAEQRPGLGL
jgi:hypothetical protein